MAQARVAATPLEVEFFTKPAEGPSAAIRYQRRYGGLNVGPLLYPEYARGTSADRAC